MARLVRKGSICSVIATKESKFLEGKYTPIYVTLTVVGNHVKR